MGTQEFAVLSRVPHSGIGGSTPYPDEGQAAAAIMTSGSRHGSLLIIGPMAFGNTCLKMIRRCSTTGFSSHNVFFFQPTGLKIELSAQTAGACDIAIAALD